LCAELGNLVADRFKPVVIQYLRRAGGHPTIKANSAGNVSASAAFERGAKIDIFPLQL